MNNPIHEGTDNYTKLFTNRSFLFKMKQQKTNSYFLFTTWLLTSLSQEIMYQLLDVTLFTTDSFLIYCVIHFEMMMSDSNFCFSFQNNLFL